MATRPRSRVDWSFGPQSNETPVTATGVSATPACCDDGAVRIAHIETNDATHILQRFRHNCNNYPMN